MNHPTHPEDQVFAGLVMGREEPVAAPAALPIAAWLRIKPSSMPEWDEYDFSANEQAGFTCPLVKLSDAQAALAAPVAAQQKDAVLQASIDFIASLTGMKPPDIEIAPPEIFAPFKTFADQICEIFLSRTAVVAPVAQPVQPATEGEVSENDIKACFQFHVGWNHSKADKARYRVVLENYEHRKLTIAQPVQPAVPVTDADIEALRKDAERYRWLRIQPIDGAPGQPVIAMPNGMKSGYYLNEETADFAVDTAMASRGQA